MFIESEVLELKERYSDSLLRDIVAFLNAKEESSILESMTEVK